MYKGLFIISLPQWGKVAAKPTDEVSASSPTNQNLNTLGFIIMRKKRLLFCVTSEKNKKRADKGCVEGVN